MDDLRQFRRTHLGRALARARWAFEAQFERRIRDRGFADFHQSDIDVIGRLPSDRGARLTELAARAPTSKQAVSKLVHGLEARGYVARHPDPEDGRAQRIVLSDRGRALLEAAVEVVAEIEAEWAAVLGAPELEQIRRALLRAADAIAGDDYL